VIFKLESKCKTKGEAFIGWYVCLQFGHFPRVDLSNVSLMHSRQK